MKTYTRASSDCFGHWDERPIHDRPMAGPGLVSYRYKGPYGFIMIGARDIRDALHEANRSLEYGKAKVENLQIWNDESKEYENAFVPITEEELIALIDEKLL